MEEIHKKLGFLEKPLLNKLIPYILKKMFGEDSIYESDIDTYNEQNRIAYLNILHDILEIFIKYNVFLPEILANFIHHSKKATNDMLYICEYIIVNSIEIINYNGKQY